ncbi:hypothetical protein BDV09DRAFT_181125 [Aspergillus tetrazonus]
MAVPAAQWPRTFGYRTCRREEEDAHGGTDQGIGATGDLFSNRRSRVRRACSAISKRPFRGRARAHRPESQHLDQHRNREAPSMVLLVCSRSWPCPPERGDRDGCRGVLETPVDSGRGPRAPCQCASGIHQKPIPIGLYLWHRVPELWYSCMCRVDR